MVCVYGLVVEGDFLANVSIGKDGTELPYRVIYIYLYQDILLYSTLN